MTRSVSCSIMWEKFHVKLVTDYLQTWRTLECSTFYCTRNCISHVIQIYIILRTSFVCVKGQAVNLGFDVFERRSAFFAFSCSLAKDFLVPGPIGTLTASTSEYPDPPGSTPPTVFANSLSIFIGSGALQLDVIGYLSFDRPCRSVLGPSVGADNGALRAFPTENCFPPWTLEMREFRIEVFVAWRALKVEAAALTNILGVLSPLFTMQAFSNVLRIE